MYHWTHLELQRYFDFYKPLSEKTSEEAWNKCNEKLSHDDMTVRSIIEKSNVRVIGTTDDPCDSLQWHKKLAEDESFNCKVVPSFRPDKMVNIDKPGFKEYITEKRINEAEKYLTQTDLSIEEIQVKIGFTNKTRFFKEFSKYYNCTPGEYRKQHQE